MPTYTYLCEQCQAAFEAFASIQKKEQGWQPRCPKCGSERTRQTFNRIGVLVGSRPPSMGGCCSPRQGRA